MWRIVTFSLLEHQQPFHVSRPTKPPEKQRLRLAQAVTLPHGTAAVSLPEPFPARLVLAAVAQQRVTSAVDVVLHSLVPGRRE